MPLRLRWLFKSLYDKNHQVLIRFQLNLFKQEVRKPVLTPIILILYGIRKNCLDSGWNRSLYLFIRREIKQTVLLIETYHCYQNTHKNYLPSCCQCSPAPEITGNHQCGFWHNRSNTDHTFCTCQILGKNVNTVLQYICGFQASRMPTNQSRGRFCIITPLSLVSIWILG